MKKLTLCVFSVLFAMTLSVEARADMLVSTPGATLDSYFRFLNDTDNNGWHYAAPFGAENLTTGQLLNTFCVDRYTYTSSDFSLPGVGQEYGAVALNSPTMTLFSDIQKSALNSLFSHVYTTITDSQNNLLNTAAAMAFQLTVWEIVHETSGVWNLANGVFGINAAATYRNSDHTGGSEYDNRLFNDVISLTSSWFSAIADEPMWVAMGYGKTDLELTVYVAEGGTHVSQTLISTTAPAAVTPEPATILMFGMGVLALPFCRRRVSRSTN